MIPKINDAFVRPLYVLDANIDHHEIGFHSTSHDYPEVRNSDRESESDVSVMDTSSENPSESDPNYRSDDSMISVTSENDDRF